MKHCPRCNLDLEITNFSKDSQKADGLRSHCKACMSLAFKQYRLRNLEKEKNRCNVYKKTNRKRMTTYENAYQKYRRQTDPVYRLRHNIRTRFTKLMKGESRDMSLESAIGLSTSELMDYLEQFFEPGMTRENNTHSGWHVDHTIPLVSAKTKEEMYALWHYTNLRPMWAKDNARKGTK